MSLSTAEASDESDLETDPEKIKSKLEKCEEELVRLRGPAAPGLAITEMLVERYELQDLLQQIMPALAENNDTTFLKDYLRVLQNEDEAVIKSVTQNVMASVEDALRQRMGLADDALGGQRVVLGAFLGAAALAGRARARPALRQLLARCSEDERETLARGWERALPTGALLALADAAQPGALAPPLQHAALARLLGRAPPAGRLAAPRLAELGEPDARWAHDSERVMLLGRMLAAAPSPLRPALLRRLSAARPAPLDARLAAADREVGVCKLQILFGTKDKVKSATKRRRRRAPREH